MPKIEEVAYKLMGVEQPSEINLKIEIGTDVLPVNDLEQVSPDSEKSNSNDRKHPSNMSNMGSGNYNSFNYFDIKIEDLESPAFEPIEPLKTELKTLNNEDDMDISDGSDTPHQMNELKSSSSSISGLTSNESNNSSNDFEETSSKNISTRNRKCDNVQKFKAKVEKPLVASCNSRDLAIDQDSELSQVSSETSTSRLSIVTNNITNSNEEFKTAQMTVEYTNAECLYGMSEETQMQKFTDSSSSPDNIKKIGTDGFSKSQTQFNIKNEKIKIEGTERMNPHSHEFMEIEEYIDMKNSDVDVKKQSSSCKFKNQREQKSQSLSRTSEKDDHFTYKGKATARQRSHSKDSNDGFALLNKAEHSNMQNLNQSKSSSEQTYTQCSNEKANTEPTEATEELLTNNIKSHPVVIDQMLIGNDLNLKTFIVENRDDPIVSSIEKDILSTNKKKPKMADNIFEAKRLTKVRKKIDLQYQKRIGNVAELFLKYVVNLNFQF